METAFAGARRNAVVSRPLAAACFATAYPTRVVSGWTATMNREMTNVDESPNCAIHSSRTALLHSTIELSWMMSEVQNRVIEILDGTRCSRCTHHGNFQPTELIELRFRG